MRTVIAGLVFLLSSNAAVLAADPEIITAPDINAARFGWGGFYAGASLGYAWLNDVDYQFPVPLEDRGEDWVFGGHVGYMHGFGNFVAGAEFEATRLDIDYEVFNFITVENSYTVKARAGYAIDRFLISGHVGGTYATTNVGLADWGWTAGAGLDYAITDNITVGAQYTHHGFKSFDGTMIDATLDVVTARVGLKF
ncbi:MAG TPA: outer membrane beta-barrel protein [Rhizobiaceae bacterium]|nr:outer membrane beta-barrel protein [Rhizobiaceae bacterium]